MFLPMHRHNPKAGEGAWERTAFQEHISSNGQQVRELFHLCDRAWFYYSTFECVGSTTLTMDEVRQLNPSSSRIIEYLHRRTLLFADLVPPVITRMVQNMYAEGVLKVQCLGFRCVGFNTELHDTLQASANSNRTNGVPISVPKEGTTSTRSGLKRGRGDERSGRSGKNPRVRPEVTRR